MPTRNLFIWVIFTALAIAGLEGFSQSAKKTGMKSTAIGWDAVAFKTNANGSSKRFFEGPTATLDMLECHASTLNPGAMNHEIIGRPHDEVIIIKEGTVEAYVDGKWLRIGPGSVIFYAANELQAMRNPGTIPASYHVVMMLPTAKQTNAPAAK
jgi:mannose-6-phosphate isomerase-like protein (cupin superfamily)